MSPDINLAAVIGSLRTESVSRIVFNAAQAVAPDGVKLHEVALAAVPIFNQDDEADGDPPGVEEMKRTVRAADGIVIFSPEYNRSMPALTKNAIDWLSRPPGDGPINTKPAGIVAVVPGQHSGEGVRAHLTDTLTALRTQLFEPSLGISSIRHRIEDGVLNDEEARSDLSNWLGDFAEFIRTNARD